MTNKIPNKIGSNSNTEQPSRCDWCGDNRLYQQYHDTEWGVPCFDEQTLFEFLLLEGAQAGLSWITILKKRDNYRRAFDQFDAEKIARYNDEKIAELKSNAGIVRNQLKIKSAINNAQRLLDLHLRGETLTDHLWRYVDGEPLQNQWHKLNDVPASTELSDKISKDFKKLGFTFFGSTICYAFMQATGMVNDHLVNCYRHSECQHIAKSSRNR